MHVTNVPNVEASISMWFASQVTAITPPDYLTTPLHIAYDWPEEELVTPCFSFHHIPVNNMPMYQGNVGGDGVSVTRAMGIFEVNAWVSRDDRYSGQDVWMARLRYMQTMVEHIHTRWPVVVIQDVITDPNSPTATTYKIDLKELHMPATLPDDANPSLRRRRMLIDYTWHLRATG